MEFIHFSTVKGKLFETDNVKVENVNITEKIVNQEWEHIFDDSAKNEEMFSVEQQQYNTNILNYYYIGSPTIHPQSENHEHRCTLCDFISPNRDDLKMHAEWVHQNIKKHKCTICDYASNQKRQVDWHLNIKDHKCTMCDYTAYRKSHFNSQVVSVHWNLKNHHCTTCDYETNRNVILKYHIESIQFNVKKHCEYQKCTSSSCRFCSFGSEESQV